jgi:arylsulfatase A-like enzyme
MQAIRIGDFKGIRYNIKNHADDFEIYNVVSDPQEKTNLSSSMRELNQTMKDKVLQVRLVNSSASRPYDSHPIAGTKPESIRQDWTVGY